MATHFARWTLTSSLPPFPRLTDEILHHAGQMPEHRRIRYLASRSLLAELMFMLYGVSQLPKIVTSASGRPHFADSTLVDFSIAYAGNIVGVLLAPEGRCGLDMELQRTFGNAISGSAPLNVSNSETIWINNQNNPLEARSQLNTLRQSIMKLSGTLKSSADTLQLLPVVGRLRVANEPQIEAISDAEDLLVWSCAAAPGIEGLKLWEYHAQQGWRGLPGVETRRRSAEGRIMRLTSIPAEKAMPHNAISKTN